LDGSTITGVVARAAIEYEEAIPFPVETEDVAVLALAVKEARILISELEGYAKSISSLTRSRSGLRPSLG
jgi:hypothetical protein